MRRERNKSSEYPEERRRHVICHTDPLPNSQFPVSLRIPRNGCTHGNWKYPTLLQSRLLPDAIIGLLLFSNSSFHLRDR